MAKSGVEIVNVALGMLGVPGIQTFDAGLGQKYRIIYETARDAMLAAHPWSWSLERRPLQQAPAQAGSRYPYVFYAPEPSIGSVRAVYERPDDDVPAVEGWTRAGVWIFCEFPTPYAEYQRDLDDTQLPDLFVDALTLRMVERLALFVKEDLPTSQYFKRLADEAEDRAQQVDQQSKPTEALSDFSYVNARVGGIGEYHRFDASIQAGPDTVSGGA